MRGVAVVLVKALAAVPAAPVLVVLAAFTRAGRSGRRRTGVRPRVAWGPVPIISICNWSRGLRRQGFETTTYAAEVFSINRREDFDVLRDELRPRGLWFEPWRDFQLFARVLREADLVVTFFDGGFLRYTALRRLEPWLLRLAGMPLIVTHYGGDAAVPGYLAAWEEAMRVDYPDLVARGEQIRARVDWLSGRADLVVRNLNPGYLPRWDVLWPAQYALDVGELVARGGVGADGRSGPATVLHAPNHRALKGTEHVLRAVEALRGEGLDVRLELIEGRPNAEVRSALARADVLVDQLLVGYGLFAVEGMASGLPVVSRTGWMPEEVAATAAMRELPIVDADAETVTDVLRELVTDPQRRAQLGAEGRRFVERCHSEQAAGEAWATLIDAVWGRRPAPREIGPAAEPCKK